MKIVFMGTPDFAAVSLDRLYKDGYNVAGVFTQPDKPRSRGMKVSCSPVKELATARGTPVFQPVSLKGGESSAIIRDLGCNTIAVVAYGKMLPSEILDLPSNGCVNIHASILPKFRGAAPIQWAVLRGERETGVTSIYMTEQLDAGDIILAKKTAIDENETAGELYGRLSLMGAELLSETMGAISLGVAIGRPQMHEDATFAPPLSKDMSPIDWNETAGAIKRKVLGLNPWPVATAMWGGTVYKVFYVDIVDKQTSKRPGEIISAGTMGLEIACADGSVIIKQLQAPGGRRMNAGEFLRGHSICQ